MSLGIVNGIVNGNVNAMSNRFHIELEMDEASLFLTYSVFVITPTKNVHVCSTTVPKASSSEANQALAAFLDIHGDDIYNKIILDHHNESLMVE